MSAHQGRSLVSRIGRGRFFLLLLLLLLHCNLGCRSNGNSEMLETALRMREQDLLMLREELAQKEFQNHLLKREVLGQRQPASPPPGVWRVPPPAFPTGRKQQNPLPRVMPPASNGAPKPAAEQLPPPQPVDPKYEPPTPNSSAGTILQPIGRWQAPTLERAFRLQRPVPLNSQP